MLAKTASRQMLGFMNEMAWSAECAIADAGGVARCDIDELNRVRNHADDVASVRTAYLSRPPPGQVARLRHSPSTWTP